MTDIRPMAAKLLCIAALGLIASCGDGSSNNSPPRAQLFAPTWVRLGDSAALDGSKSTDPDGDIVSYLFVVADGSASHRSPSGKTDHHFLISGLIEVRLVVTDSAGQRSEVRRVISVRPDGSSQ